MSSLPYPDYYSILEVGNDASLQEITASYRRLALINHPDKNPENSEEATAAFQKIQLAYETLSDDKKRMEYDCWYLVALSISSSSDDYTSESSTDGPPRRVYPHPPGFCYIPTKAGRRDDADEADKKHEKRPTPQDEAKKAREDAKKAEEELRAEQKEQSRIAEKQKQEARWEALKAHTKAKKLKTCLHSSFCTKVQQKQKFKCPVCDAKRGTIAFLCPHCDLSICQKCVADYGKKRTEVEKQAAQKAKQAAKDAKAAEFANPASEPHPEPKHGHAQKSKSKPKPEPKLKAKSNVKAEPVREPTPEKETHEVDDEEKTTKPKVKRGKGGQNKRQTQPRCWRCDGIGHLARECPVKKEDKKAGKKEGEKKAEVDSA
ncbi:hypothetical protein F5Y04DRAFT_293456 [Hypomontagnella monticulosa]|nr:hypothetical protein F5Y04DRAFT_293456 [Hypomontagnella monticulosa]